MTQRDTEIVCVCVCVCVKEGRMEGGRDLRVEHLDSGKERGADLVQSMTDLEQLARRLLFEHS